MLVLLLSFTTFGLRIGAKTDFEVGERGTGDEALDEWRDDALDDVLDDVLDEALDEAREDIRDEFRVDDGDREGDTLFRKYFSGDTPI